jgi:PKD repeat protein
MRFTLGLLAGALLAIAGCGGSVRQLQGHSKPDSVVTAIKPTSGVSGQAVTFEAQVCTQTGLPAPTYLWNFGGGADPNVSFEEKPAETLRAGSATPYNASLTLSGGCLGANLSATYPFTLAIAPLQIISVVGATGVSGKNGVFSVVLGTGVVTKYFWDFGGATTTSGATTASPSVTFGAAGVYAASVTVANDYEVATQNFTITVL